MRVVLMGPPGAGKGTQADILAEQLDVPHISTGEIFRVNVAAATELGLEARRYMEAGDYVPDEVTNAMVADRLAQDDAAAGFLLDGYPRTLAQVDELDRILSKLGTAIDHVVELTADTAQLAARLHNRAKVEGRTDDTEKVIKRRMNVYREETEPLIAVYRKRGLLVQVDGMGSVEDVSKRLIRAIED